MGKKKRLTHRILLGSLLFGMFFGAGNLIFPIAVGQRAGSSLNIASFGFILTGVGLASLAAIYCAKSEALSLESMLSVYGKHYARFFTIALLLTIGPLFALPRTATVPYEVGLKVLFPDVNHTTGLLVYSLIFFMFSLLMALKPNKLKDLIGKYINPIFLICLLIFFIVFFMNQMGPVHKITPVMEFKEETFLPAFVIGYQTMDVLAALAFSFVVISTNNFDLEHATKKDKINDVIFAGIFAGVLMAIIYYILARIGASSRNLFDVSENGGIALGQIFYHYFGRLGTAFLSITITIACLKTSTGLIVACSQYFNERFKKISYKNFAYLFATLGFLISNIGLNAIIEYAIPVLNFIYPLAIMHILMGLFYNGKSRIIYKSVLITTLIAACLEFIGSFPVLLSAYPSLKAFINWYREDLLFSKFGMAWLGFSIIGLMIGIIVNTYHKKRIKAH